MCPRGMDEMSKQGLYFWLRSVVESGRCPGVAWIDEANGVFQIPWSNQKSRTWQKEDSSVFLEYAKHTCKYKTGDKMDFPKWKQNLKSAINKNRYIERLRARDHLSGPKPYRVYRFMNEKAEGKKISSDFPDVKNETTDVFIQARLLAMENTERIVNPNEVFLAQNDVSASGTLLYTNGGTRPARSSPQSATSLSGGFLLYPDIPRSDSCDYPQGNIPTIISGFCDTPDLLSGDESLQSVLPEPTVTEESQTARLNINIPSCQEINDDKESLAENHVMILNPFIVIQGNDDQLQQSFKMLLTDQEQMQSPILSDLIAKDPCDMLQINCASQNSVCANFRQDSSQQTGAEAMHISIEADTLQKSPLNPNRDRFLNLSHQGNPDAGLVPPVLDLQQVASQNYISQKNLQMQQTRQEIHSGIKSCVPEQMPTSIPELSSYNDCSSSLTSSMDTYDSNQLSGSQKFQGSQFTTYRNDHKSEDTSKAIPISPTVKTVTDDSVMHVQVLYGTPHRTVQKITITSKQNSCRLFYGAVRCSVMQEAIRGQQAAEEVELPPVDTPDQEYQDEDKKDAIRKILKDMELGIVISYSNDDIFVERRCLPRVYLSDGVSKSESLPRSTKKRPDVKTLAFDYNKHFKESIEKNKTNNGAVPKDHFLLTIGYQIIPNDDSPTRMVPVYIVVRHVKAAVERFNILGASTIAPNPMCSDPNSFDKNIQLFKEIDLK